MILIKWQQMLTQIRNLDEPKSTFPILSGSVYGREESSSVGNVEAKWIIMVNGVDTDYLLVKGEIRNQAFERKVFPSEMIGKDIQTIISETVLEALGEDPMSLVYVDVGSGELASEVYRALDSESREG